MHDTGTDGTRVNFMLCVPVPCLIITLLRIIIVLIESRDNNERNTK